MFAKDSNRQPYLHPPMTKRIIVLLAMNFCLISTFSQSWDEVIRNTQTYLSGEGWGATVEEADQQALAALISKISVVVSNDFSITEDERTTNGKLDAASYTTSKVQTYSTATLTNTERIVIDNNPEQAHIGRFIKRSELNKIFEGRIRTIKEYIRLGKMADGCNTPEPRRLVVSNGAQSNFEDRFGRMDLAEAYGAVEYLSGGER